MVDNGLARIAASVRDLDEALAFFRDILEMKVAARAELDAAAFGRLWRLPRCTRVRAAWLANDRQSTRIELLEVAPNSGRSLRAGANSFDFGLFDVAVRAADIDAAYGDLRRRGWEFLSAPVTYEADWVSLTVKEVILIGPERMPIALIERLTGDKPVIRGRFGDMVDSAQFVSDMERSLAFYTGVLGYEVFFDRELRPGLIDEVVALPPGARARMALLVRRGSASPAVELIQCSASSRSLAAEAGPDRFGIFALGFATADLDGLLARTHAAGYPIVGGPVETVDAAGARVRAAVIRGPDDVLLEFFEAAGADGARRDAGAAARVRA